MRTSLLLLLSVSLLIAAPAPSQAPTTAELTAADRIIQEGMEASQVMRHLDHLVNKIGPRLTSSENLTEACEWAVQTFKSFGLESARLYEWGTFPVGFDRGVMIGRMLTPELEPLELTTPSWMPGTRGLQRGHVVLAPTNEDELAALGDEVKGAWVVHRRSQRRRGGLRGKATERVRELGALGEIVASWGATNDLVITGGNSRVKWDELPDFPRILLSKASVKKIADHVAAGKRVELEFDIDNRFRRGPVPLYNVIADIPGEELPDEYVIVGGHIDSWDGATGTTDNGTGVATTLEAARLLMAAGVHPKRTIRFMLWSGEEQGLLGSRAWIRQNKDELAKISAVLVHDGGTNYVSGIFATPAMKKDFDAVFAPVAALDDGMPFEVTEREGLPERIGSDHDAFLREGVPGFFWRQKGRANYTFTHHTQNDLFRAAVPEYQRHTSIVVAVGALGIANLPHKLSREGLKSRTSRQRPRLGINVDEDMKISSVVKGMPADHAGLEIGDKLLEIGGVKIEDMRSLIGAIIRPEYKKKVVFERGGKRMEVEAVWPELAPNKKKEEKKKDKEAAGKRM